MRYFLGIISPSKGAFLLQLAAYCGAINRMYVGSISHGVVVALPDSEAQVFQFELGVLISLTPLAVSKK